MPPRKSSESPPKIPPPRPRVICPSCHTEIVFYKMPAQSNQAIQASTIDMWKLDFCCENEACVLYLEGIEPDDKSLVANPVIPKCIAQAKHERACFNEAEEEKRREKDAAAEMKREEDEAVEYIKYDPFRGYPEEAAALEKEKQQKIETEAIIDSWKNIKKYAEEMEKMESEEKM
ncbi:hypothetical protein Daus18300_005728 [Diaporthe australafricana]|uniref:Uncharacterized protein n=1 Tax=Diaporthe australafricana TaxID=127596 RepID=A0ABR3WZ09_9PEZI